MAYTLPERSDKNWDVSLQTIFNQVASDVENAGTGTALVRTGTRAERLALSSPTNGLIWVETDTLPRFQIYIYSTALGDWVNREEQAALAAQFYA